MDSFSFEIILNYGLETLAIKPPSSYNSLIEVAKEKFDLFVINRLVYIDDDEEVKIASDSDYFTLFDFVETNNLKEIDLIIKSDEEKAKRKKSLRKNSRCPLRPPVKQNMAVDEGCVNGIK